MNTSIKLLYASLIILRLSVAVVMLAWTIDNDDQLASLGNPR